MARPKASNLEELLAGFARHDTGALARLITKVDNRAAEVGSLMERIYPQTGAAHIVGITGPPGAGKSTLISKLVSHYRALKKQVAVLAIDPSSRFSGGAVLGDRIRMGDHYKDKDVYIRSLSSRGSHGGLSRAAREIVKLLDAFGYNVIIVETVGVGQTELAVMDLAHTTVVVTVPEGGDGIQVMKAGLNEIADIFVVNKADRDGADRVKAELELSVHLSPKSDWPVPVILTQANNDKGVDTVIAQLERHREYLSSHSDPARERERILREFREIFTGELEERAMRSLADGGAKSITAEIAEGRLNPYTAARKLIDDPDEMARLLNQRKE